jgi:hypothetical protein
LSGLVGGYLLQSSRKSINGFVTSLSEEQQVLDRLGDADRISTSILENEDKLVLIGDLNFVVSPLIATAGRALEEGDVDAAVSASCSVLDECVRLAPFESSSNSIVMGSADVGLSKFLSLFEDLGGVEEEESLALAYVGLTGHVTKKITFAEAVEHLTQLNNALYHIGALRPDIKDSIDDNLNKRAMKQAVEEIDKELASGEEEIPSPDVVSKSVEKENAESSSLKEESELDDDLMDQMLHASVEAQEPEGESIEPEMNITGADVVTARTRKQKRKKKDTQQLSLLDEIDLEEERESASV